MCMDDLYRVGKNKIYLAIFLPDEWSGDPRPGIIVCRPWVSWICNPLIGVQGAVPERVIENHNGDVQCGKIQNALPTT